MENSNPNGKFLDLSTHLYAVHTYRGKVLGHFSTPELAVLTAAQRKSVTRGKLFLNGAPISPVALHDALENYAQEEGAEECDV